MRLDSYPDFRQQRRPGPGLQQVIAVAVADSRIGMPSL